MRHITLFLLSLLVLSATLANARIAKTIQTEYPTKDGVISDFIVTDFGARAQKGYDNRAAFQCAIDAAYSAGGGVVFIPSGHYEFLSTMTASDSVRVREGAKSHFKSIQYNYVLKLPVGVQLRGDWADPSANDGKVLGTVLEVRVGKDAPAADAYVSSWWNDPQAGNALRTTYTSVADRFIEMNASTGVTNLSIWYPEQDIDDVKPYPWTLFQKNGDCATVEHVTLVNSYNGVYCAPAELHYIHDDYITALNKGIEIHVCTDIGRVENVYINPGYWARSGLPGAPSYEKVRDFTIANTTGYQMHRSDWEYVSYLNISGCRTGIWIGREPGFADAPNAQLFEMHVEDCMDALYVQSINPYGILVSNSSFKAAQNGHSAYVFEDFRTSLQFNGVTFDGPVVSDGRDGVISFENCNFAACNAHAISLNGGNALLTQCGFGSESGHIYLGEAAVSLGSVNSGFEGRIDVKNAGNAEERITFDPSRLIDPIPSKIRTDIPVQPKAGSDMVIRGNFHHASGYNNDAPKVDVSLQIQKALDKLSHTGGTLYLPAGRYLVSKPITIPSGVELRGSWDVPHHTMGGGTAILTDYDGNARGESLISLKDKAGIRGVTISQLDIVSGNGFSPENPRELPFLIQGQGHDVYVINVTIGVGDKGIDLATYNTSGHYVEYLGGLLLRAGIWIGGGAEGGYIRNMQLNPHYGSRLPRGGQGYPQVNMMRYIQSHCSALKFADVKGQTIFNNFVYGSVYGIHFLKDSVTGRYPGSLTMVGHGSDGCTFSLFVEDADSNTRIIGINSELVNTRIKHQRLRSYVLMDRDSASRKVDPKARLVLYNSAFWGSPTAGVTANSGTLVLSQANFASCGHPCIDIYGGTVEAHTSYFAEKMLDGPIDGRAYVRNASGTGNIGFFNNYFADGFLSR
ncbi:MAG: poly(beta-D-mannuronate) C5 epimerase [Bacteroidales bacterium]|nr:poly(beta-D-mannuronate) C5 epimerase [Candidatus Hennigimonas equi]